MLIGLTGRAGAGKDSCAKVLVAAGWQSIAFADALRVEAAAAWGVDPRVFHDRHRKEHSTPQLAATLGQHPAWLRWAEAQGHDMRAARSPRWVMQQWGSFRRDADPEHWVKPVVIWLTTQRRHGRRNLVITDVRLANEAAAVADLGGHVVRVHRTGAPALATDTDKHSSERHHQIVAAADIHNDGDLPALSAEVWRVAYDLARPAAAEPAGAA